MNYEFSKNNFLTLYISRNTIFEYEIKIWNNISAVLKSTENKNKFKKLTKNYLIDKM